MQHKQVYEHVGNERSLFTMGHQIQVSRNEGVVSCD